MHTLKIAPLMFVFVTACASVSPITRRDPALAPIPSATMPEANPATPTVAVVTQMPPPGVTSTSNSRGFNTATPVRGDSLFASLIKPFVAEASRRRAERAKSDPEYSKRVLKELNESRLNFLLYGYGETHEPPATERAIIGSITIVSLNIKTFQADVISLTHDIRAPSIEAEAPDVRGKVYAQKIDQAYPVGGFRLMRRVLENATGLSIDFQIAFKDIAIQRLIDSVFEGVTIDVPEAFDVNPFYLEGKKYPAAHFSKGKQTLDGRQVIQFIKTVPVASGYYGKSLEHNVRKHLIFRAMLREFSKETDDVRFWLKASGFAANEVLNGSIAFDFDFTALGLDNMGDIISRLRRVAGEQPAADPFIPEIDKTIYVADPANGDGGVQWVGANAAVNPITQRDLRDEKYITPDMTIPLDANPYGDLITGYWTSVRTLVRKTVLAEPASSSP